jgi:hypothetical protein
MGKKKSTQAKQNMVVRTNAPSGIDVREQYRTAMSRYIDPLIVMKYHNKQLAEVREVVAEADPIASVLTHAFSEAANAKMIKFYESDQLDSPEIMTDLRAMLKVFKFQEYTKEVMLRGQTHGWWIPYPYVDENGVPKCEVYSEYECKAEYITYDLQNNIQFYNVNFQPRVGFNRRTNLHWVRRKFTPDQVLHGTRGRWNYGFGYSVLEGSWDAITKLREESHTNAFKQKILPFVRVPDEWTDAQIDDFMKVLARTDEISALVMRGYINPNDGTMTDLPAVTWATPANATPAKSTQGSGGSVSDLSSEWSRLTGATRRSVAYFVGGGALSASRAAAGVDSLDDVDQDIIDFNQYLDEFIIPFVKWFASVIGYKVPDTFTVKGWWEWTRDEALYSQIVAAQQQANTIEGQANDMQMNDNIEEPSDQDFKKKIDEFRKNQASETDDENIDEEQEFYYRYANEDNIITPSRESYDRVVDFFDYEENLMKIYKNYFYPDLTWGDIEYDSIDDLLEDVADYAKNADADEEKLEVLKLMGSVLPYHGEMDKELGVVLVADNKAVNVLIGTNISGVPVGLPLHKLKGKIMGLNMAGDGYLLAEPEIIEKNIDLKLKKEKEESDLEISDEDAHDLMQDILENGKASDLDYFQESLGTERFDQIKNTIKDNTNEKGSKKKTESNETSSKSEIKWQRSKRGAYFYKTKNGNRVYKKTTSKQNLHAQEYNKHDLLKVMKDQARLPDTVDPQFQLRLNAKLQSNPEQSPDKLLMEVVHEIIDDATNQAIQKQLDYCVRNNLSMPMSAVSSSTVKGVGLNENKLLVEFHGEKGYSKYAYDLGDPAKAQATWSDMMQSTSKGGFVWDQLRGEKMGPAWGSGKPTEGGTYASLVPYEPYTRNPVGFMGAKDRKDFEGQAAQLQEQKVEAIGTDRYAYPEERGFQSKSPSEFYTEPQMFGGQAVGTQDPIQSAGQTQIMVGTDPNLPSNISGQVPSKPAYSAGFVWGSTGTPQGYDQRPKGMKTKTEAKTTDTIPDATTMDNNPLGIGTQTPDLPMNQSDQRKPSTAYSAGFVFGPTGTPQGYNQRPKGMKTKTEATTGGLGYNDTMGGNQITDDTPSDMTTNDKKDDDDDDDDTPPTSPVTRPPPSSPPATSVSSPQPTVQATTESPTPSPLTKSSSIQAPMAVTPFSSASPNGPNAPKKSTDGSITPQQTPSTSIASNMPQTPASSPNGPDTPKKVPKKEDAPATSISGGSKIPLSYNPLSEAPSSEYDDADDETKDPDAPWNKVEGDDGPSKNPKKPKKSKKGGSLYDDDPDNPDAPYNKIPMAPEWDWDEPKKPNKKDIKESISTSPYGKFQSKELDRYKTEREQAKATSISKEKKVATPKESPSLLGSFVKGLFGKSLQKSTVGKILSASRDVYKGLSKLNIGIPLDMSEEIPQEAYLHPLLQEYGSMYAIRKNLHIGDKKAHELIEEEDKDCERLNLAALATAMHTENPFIYKVGNGYRIEYICPDSLKTLEGAEAPFGLWHNLDDEESSTLPDWQVIGSYQVKSIDGQKDLSEIHYNDDWEEKAVAIIDRLKQTKYYQDLKVKDWLDHYIENVKKGLHGDISTGIVTDVVYNKEKKKWIQKNIKLKSVSAVPMGNCTSPYCSTKDLPTV